MMSKDITITSIETVTGFDIGTNDFLFMLDELQQANISQGQETTDITGRQGRLLNTLKRNKTVTVTGTNGFLSGGLTEMQTGSEFSNGEIIVNWYEYLTISSNAATTTYKGVGTSGAEITALFIRSDDGSMGTKLEQAASPADGKFAYAPATKALTFSSGAYENGTEIAVFYKRKITADYHKNSSSTYSKKCKIVVDALGEDKCSNIYRLQFQFDKADFKGDFGWDMGDNQAVHEFEFTSLAGSCGNSADLWTYVIFGENTVDTP